VQSQVPTGTSPARALPRDANKIPSKQKANTKRNRTKKFTALTIPAPFLRENYPRSPFERRYIIFMEKPPVYIFLEYIYVPGKNINIVTIFLLLNGEHDNNAHQ
jgi:hypothetical protein